MGSKISKNADITPPIFIKYYLYPTRFTTHPHQYLPFVKSIYGPQMAIAKRRLLTFGCVWCPTRWRSNPRLDRSPVMHHIAFHQGRSTKGRGPSSRSQLGTPRLPYHQKKYSRLRWKVIPTTSGKVNQDRGFSAVHIYTVCSAGRRSKSKRLF